LFRAKPPASDVAGAVAGRPDPPQPLPSLAGAPWLSNPRLASVITALESEGGGARVVGGAVREALIGRPVREVDVATTVTPEEVVRLAGLAGLKAVATGIEHGTITVIAGGVAYEVTTLRRDVETDGRRAVVAFTTDWAADAARRDFTINALYVALDGTLHDPVGGYRDIAARRVRFIGEPRDRIREDYLRILRLFRIHAEFGHGGLDPGGVEAAGELRGGLCTLSRERVRQELMRLLAAPGAASVVPVMDRRGILEALELGAIDLGRFARLTEIERAAGLAGDAVLALAALALPPGEPGAPVRLGERLRLSRAETARLAALAGPDEVSPSMDERARRRFVYRAGAAAARDRVLMAWAASDAGADDPGWRDLLAMATSWRAPGFPLRGRDLRGLGIPPGARLGEALGEIERRWVEADFRPGRDELLAWARELADCRS
jgi:poly(A) polymerase